jgi:hypothetical protein
LNAGFAPSWKTKAVLSLLYKNFKIMEIDTVKEDIHLICVRAVSFPDGITEALQKLEQADASIGNRTLYGISHGSENGIIYWAAVKEAYKGEAAALGLEKYMIRKGVYATQTVKNIRGNEAQVGMVFNKLLAHPKLDQTGECIERYKSNDEVVCMVRLTE